MLNFLVRWHSSAVSLAQGDVIFAQLVCPMIGNIFCLYQVLLKYLSINIVVSTANTNELLQKSV